MKEKPRDINTPILNKSFASEVIMEGLLIAVIIGYLLLIMVLTLRSLMGVFEGAVLNTSQFSYIYILSIIPLIVVQVYKLLFVRVED